MRSRRSLMSLSMVAVVSLFVLLITACGGGTSNADKTATAQAKTSTTGTPRPATSTPAAPSGTGTPQKAGAVNVLGIWGDGEHDSFNAMVAPWQQQTGGSVNFTGSRNITSDLTLRVQGGNPPDIAIPAETGLFQQFATSGKLAKLSDCPGLEEAVKADYPAAFQDLGTVNGTLYGFFMKVDSKADNLLQPEDLQLDGLADAHHQQQLQRPDIPL